MSAEKRRPIPRSTKCLLALLAVLLLPLAIAEGDEPRVRKNIDELSSQQLANYLHAVERLKEISRENPTSKDGYDYFAALHNSLRVGPCEHSSDTFLPWHRAHLLEFEDALRRSDPPRTANVTVPYWEWSRPPSGKRYPAPFEDPASVLFFPGRFSTPICAGPPSPECERLPYPWSYLAADVLSVDPWFGTGPDHFGGTSNEAEECRDRDLTGYGALEQPSHNDMHSVYIGAAMANPSTAARDPIFWSFHAFIDLLFDRWQAGAGRTVDTCLECRFCGLVHRDGGAPWQVKETLSTSKLGYRYEFTPPAAPEAVEPLAVPKRLFPPFPGIDFALAGRRPAALMHTREVVVPEEVPGPAMLRFKGVPVPDSFSYQGNVYLYPESEDFTPRETGFHELYLVGVYSIWQGHDHEAEEGHEAGGEGMADEVEIAIDLTDELRTLSAVHAGETWHVTVALVAVDLAAESLQSFAAEVLPSGGSFAEAMAFDDMDLEVLP